MFLLKLYMSIDFSFFIPFSKGLKVNLGKSKVIINGGITKDGLS